MPSAACQVAIKTQALTKKIGIDACVTYMWASLLGTIRRSWPTMACPVALTRLSPLAVSGISDEPV